MEQLDANISRVRTDYDIIDPEKLEDDDDSIEDIEHYYEENDPSYSSEPNDEVEHHHVEERKGTESKELDKLIKTGASNDEQASDVEESEESDYENHNPSFLQLNDEDQQEAQPEKVNKEVHQEKEFEKSENGISSENPPEIPDEKLQPEGSDIPYYPSESSYLNEIND